MRSLPVIFAIGATGCHIIAGYDDFELREDPEPIWSHSYGDEARQAIEDVSANGGDVFAVGEFDGNLEIGGDVLENTGERDVFVFALDDAGNPRWTQRFIADDPAAVRSVTSTADRVFVAGSYTETLAVGLTMLPPPVAHQAQGLGTVSEIARPPPFKQGRQGFFLATLDRNDGAVVDARSYGALTLIDTKIDVATDSSGALLIAGGFGAAENEEGMVAAGTIDLGCAEVLDATGALEVFVAKLDGAECLWAHKWGGGQLQAAEGIGVDIDRNVVVGGEFQGDLRIDEDTTLMSRGGIDIFLVSLDPEGNLRWNKQFGDPAGGLQGPVRVGVELLGNVVLAGYFQGTLDFGGGPLTSDFSRDFFVARFDRNGTLLWSKQVSTEGEACTLTDCRQDRIGLVVDPQGDIVIAGHFDGAVDFGGTPLTSNGDSDIFVAKLRASDGSLLWSGSFGDETAQCTPGDCAIAATADGGSNIILGGYFTGSVDFGLGAHASAGDTDAFMVKMGP